MCKVCHCGCSSRGVDNHTVGYSTTSLLVLCLCHCTLHKHRQSRKRTRITLRGVAGSTTATSRISVTDVVVVTDQEAIGSWDNSEAELSALEEHHPPAAHATLQADRQRLKAELYVATDILEKVSIVMEERKENALAQ